MSKCTNNQTKVLDSHDTVLSIIDISEKVSNHNSNRNEIIVRTAIQKLVYFTQQTHINSELPEFKTYFYGPYSPKISLVLEELVSYYFVDEKKIIGKDYDGYKYRINEEGGNIIERIKKESKDEYREIESLITKCNEVCELEATPLSYAAKVHHTINDTTKDMNIDYFMKRWKELGWELSDKDVDQGINLLEKLKLIKDAI